MLLGDIDASCSGIVRCSSPGQCCTRCPSPSLAHDSEHQSVLDSLMLRNNMPLGIIAVQEVANTIHPKIKVSIDCHT